MGTRGSGERGSALWGKGPRGESGRKLALLVVLALCVVLPAPAFAAAPKKPAPDKTPPTTTITSGPVSLSVVNGPVTFTFAANEPATFACSVDGSPFGACTTRNSEYLASPVFGLHTFRVRATDTAGNVESTPQSVMWTTPYSSAHAYLPGSLLAQAQASPSTIFDVIVQVRTVSGLSAVQQGASSKSNGLGKTKVKPSFKSINGFEAKLPGWIILYVADSYPQVLSITPNVQVKADDFGPVQVWQRAVSAQKLWTHDAVTCTTDPDTGLPTDPSCDPIAAYTAPAAPTIAVVDSGIDGSRAADFGARVIGHTSFVSTQTNADDYGHGTFVASIAAGSANQYPGVAPTSNLYDLRVMDSNGVASTSDVINAADWILANRETYNIRVANFSLHSAKPNSFKFDPLDKAVESLWFKGVVVVAASGNFGVDAATPSNMFFAPGNDPFVITVGAADTHDTGSTSDDDTAPWSAFGYTADGFAKPELVAPGRYMIGAVPPAATMAAERPDHVIAPGYMQISGTSFATPAVAGAAANLLALHPDWNADDVKGALMQTAQPLSVANPLSAGVGEIDEAAAAAVDKPANPNAALDQFVLGGAFDSAAWQTAAQSDMSWSDMSWSDMSWSDMSWASMSWSDMSWASMSWSDESQADASTADMSWSDGSSVD